MTTLRRVLSNPAAAPPWLLAAVALASLSTACGSDEPGAGMAAAGERGGVPELRAPAEEAPDAEVSPAPAPESERVREARAEVEDLREEVEEAEGELAEARAELAEAEARLARLRREAASAARVPDAQLFRDVQRRLLESAALSHVAIAAEVSDGVVTLHGAVEDVDTANLAATLAGQVEGVRQVRNEIEIVE